MNQFYSFLTWAVLTLMGAQVFAQGVGINPTGANPDPSAILDVDAVDKGVLLPRTTTASVLNPAEGIVIYDTLSHRFKYYNGMEWCALVQEGAYAFYWADMDGDGFGYPFNVIYSPNPPEFYVDNNDDCDDSDPDSYPMAPEICDNADNDCNGLVDEDDPGITGLMTFYQDLDGDGYGNFLEEIQACPTPMGYVSNNGDCDDADPAVNEGAQEICDGIDNNCNQLIDDDDPEITGLLTFYEDSDGDNYGNPMSTFLGCEALPGYVEIADDCNDMDPLINPVAVEVCDLIDNNCNGLIDDDDPEITGLITFYEDSDGDNYGNPMSTFLGCEALPGYVEIADDCNDMDPLINPVAGEICDLVDNNCNGLIDDDDPGITGLLTFYEDSDDDGYGNPATTAMACEAPFGYVSNDDDCDDQDPLSYPGAIEICDLQDNDCDGETDEGFELLTDPFNCGSCGIVCDDGVPCTIDFCVAGICSTSIETNKCYIEGNCYNANDLNPSNECQICDPALSQNSWTNLTGTTCGGNGVCNNGVCQQ